MDEEMKFKKFLNKTHTFEGYFKIDNKWSKRYETEAPSEVKALSNFMKRLADDSKVSVEIMTRKFSQKEKKWFPNGSHDYIIRKIR